MITELTEHIKFIRADGAAYPYGHGLLIDDEIRCMVDTGAGEKVLTQINPESIDWVVNTHYHRDHTRLNGLFGRALRMIHRLDVPPLVDETARDYYTGFFEWEEVIGHPRGPLRQDARLQSGQFEPMRVDQTIEEGTVLHFGRTSAVVMHLPGHTPGHCGLFFKREGIVYAGDIDLTPVGPWYGDYLSNLDDFLASIERLIALQPAVYCCGHRKPIRENITDRLKTYRQVIFDREERILTCLRERPGGLRELIGRKLIFPGYENDYLVFWERTMIKKHLDRLLKHGEIQYASEERFTAV
ncbi:MAG: MBL fold metallo-hydrolase [Solirubrobacterales bacterium]